LKPVNVADAAVNAEKTGTTNLTVYNVLALLIIYMGA